MSDKSFDSCSGMENVEDVQLECDEPETSPASQLMLYRENPIRDICILHKDFDLSSVPSNYMRRRSKIEEIIYRASYSQNSSKSPFASFKIATECIRDLDKINIVTGINSLKTLIKSAYTDNQQISIIVHKIGDSWLLDEFDLNALFLRHQHYANWDWIRDFIKQQRLQISKPDLSRSSLTMRDLYAKFLYHSVSQRGIQPITADSLNESDNLSQLPISPCKNDTQLASESKKKVINLLDVYKEDFLNLLDWKLEDLSFVVGSDLSIFGTKSHPCISLRLSPNKEPINILTGIDIWLENLLNEVPEVAMCYHDQGIIMREYEILKTEDIPHIAGFDRVEVESIAKNLSHFLSSNATKEGHTYWLFKETDSSMVKLYDLTGIWEREQKSMKDNKNTSQNNNNLSSDNYNDSNPFILPVAILCYKLAENRITMWHKARERRVKVRLSSTQFNKELLDNKLADNAFYFSEIFRLLKNCINLLQKTDKHEDIVRRAMMLMCCLYLEVDQNTLNNLHFQIDSDVSDVVKLDLSDLKRGSTRNPEIVTDSVSSGENLLVGSKLFGMCLTQNTQRIVEQAVSLIESTDFDKHSLSLSDEELLFRNTLFLGKPIDNDSNSLDTMEIPINIQKTTLLKSLILFYKQKCFTKSIDELNIEELRILLKSGFMVALLDEDHLKNLKEFQVDCNLIQGFIRWHCEPTIHIVDQAISSATKLSASILDKCDSKVLNFFFHGRQDKLCDAIWMFKSIFMLENERMSLNVNDRIHKGWYRVVLYLTSLSYKLSQCNLSKSVQLAINRSMPIFFNFLVLAIVSMYQQKQIFTLDDVGNSILDLSTWCQDTVIPCINWITGWTEMQNFDSDLDQSLVALVFSNKAKLYRLTAYLLDDIQYGYLAIESYSKAIEILLKTNRKKPNDFIVNIKCDRLDQCMYLIENAYKFQLSSDSDDNQKVSEINRAIEFTERIYRIELPFQNIDSINARLLGLKRRLNFIRYYLNVTKKKSLNYDQVINDFKKDIEIITSEKESLSTCQEFFLVFFYMSKIQADRADVLSFLSIRQFLLDSINPLVRMLNVPIYCDHLHCDGEKNLTHIFTNLLLLLKTYVSKCNSEIHRRKKKSMGSSKLNELANFISSVDDRQQECRPFDLLSELLSEIKSKV